MVETSGLGGTYGGWAPAGTPHYSGYRSYGWARTRSRRRMADAYASAYTVKLAVYEPYEEKSRLAQSVAFAMALYFAYQQLTEDTSGVVDPVVAEVRTQANSYATGLSRWASLHIQNLDRTLYRSNRGGSPSTGGSYRRRVFADEYAYKF